MLMTAQQTYSTSPLSDYQTDSESIVSPEHSLKVALGQINRRTSAKQIFFAWPNLEEACRKLARMLTHQYPFNQTLNLLQHSIHCAFMAYDIAAQNSTKESAPMAAFLNELLECAAGTINFNVYGVLMTGKTIEWRPFELPLVDWLRKTKSVRLIFVPTRRPPTPEEIKSARILLASHVLSFEDVVFIESRTI